MPEFYLIEGDCRETMGLLPENSFDAVVTDPPYELNYMGRGWDRRGVAFEQETWERALRVLKPGAHGLVFGGARTHHRLMCTLEDAEFEIRDVLMWMYGSGFPKGMNISKAIDRELGAEREVIEQVRVKGGGMEHVNRVNAARYSYRPDGYQKGENVLDVTMPTTEAAKQFDGWNSSLKSAFEPIILVRKPISEGNIAKNVLKWGTGGINVGATRIGYQSDADRESVTPQGIPTSKAFNIASKPDVGNAEERVGFVRPELSGRWPANILFEHGEGCRVVSRRQVPSSASGESLPSPTHNRRMDSKLTQGTTRYGDEEGMEEVEDWECEEGCPVKLLDEQSGESASAKRQTKGSLSNPNEQYQGHFSGQAEVSIGYSDKGGASRFFYCGKASPKERDLGCESLYWRREGSSHAPISLEEWDSLPPNQRAQGAVHPTIKPIHLMRYLIRLITPPNGIVLDPFIGSGSTAIAAWLEGFSCVGMENDQSSVLIANARWEAREEIGKLVEKRKR